MSSADEPGGRRQRTRAPPVTTVEKPNALWLKRSVYYNPSYSPSTKRAIDLVDRAGKTQASGTVEVQFQESRMGKMLGSVTADSSRLFPIGPSISSLSPDMRGIALSDSGVSITIKNIGPTALAHNHPSRQELASFVENRDTWLQQVTDYYGINRGAAEGLFAELAYGGDANLWRKKNAPTTHGHPQVVLDYAHAVKSFTNELVQSNPNQFQAIKDYRDEESGAAEEYPETRLLSNSLYITERKMISAMQTHIGSRLGSGAAAAAAAAARNVQSILVNGIVVDLLEGETIDSESVRSLVSECTVAVQTIVPNATCEAKRPRLPDWFDPEAKLPFETERGFAHSVANLAVPMAAWFPVDQDSAIDENECATLWLGQLAKGGTMRPPRLLNMQEVGFNTATIQTSIVNAHGPLHGAALEANMESEVLRLLSYRNNTLGPALYRWWINHFFAQLNSGAGEIIEFSFGPDGTTIDDYWIICSRELLVKYAEMKKVLGSWLIDPNKRRIDGLGFFVRREDAKPGFVNVFSGLPVKAINIHESLAEPELMRVNRLLERILWHLRVILASDDNATYNFLRKYYAYVIQGRGKTRIFLVFFSLYFQTGKGALTIDFIGNKILGKYHYAPKAQLDDPNGLLGRFNWPYREKLLITMDEMGGMMFNKKAIGNLRAWLCADVTDFKKEGSPPVRMNDYANLQANTNTVLAMNVEVGDARNVVIHVDERYSLHAAENGWVVEGTPMTVERRRDYFNDLYEAINDPLCQAAFAHDMHTEDCATFDFQSNIPENDLRDSLKEVHDDSSWMERFLAAWAAGEVSYRPHLPHQEEGEYGPPPKRIALTRDVEYEAPDLFDAIKDWASSARIDYLELNCRSSRNVGTKLTGAVKNRVVEKRRSNGKTFYKLPPLP